MTDGPAVVLVDFEGNEVTLEEGQTIIATNSGLLILGKDGTTARFLKVDANGSPVIVGAGTAGSPTGGVVSVQGVSGGQPIAVSDVGSTRVSAGQYFASTDLINGAAAAQNLLTITNPAASGKLVYINSLDMRGFSTGNSSVNFMYKLLRTASTPTGGTILNFQKRATEDDTSVVTLRTLPTTTYAPGILWASSPGHTGRPVEIDFTFFTEADKNEIQLAENESLVIYVDANSTIWKHWINISWYEVTI